MSSKKCTLTQAVAIFTWRTTRPIELQSVAASMAAHKPATSRRSSFVTASRFPNWNRFTGQTWRPRRGSKFILVVGNCLALLQFWPKCELCNVVPAWDYCGIHRWISQHESASVAWGRESSAGNGRRAARGRGEETGVPPAARERHAAERAAGGGCGGGGLRARGVPAAGFRAAGEKVRAARPAPRRPGRAGG